MSERVFGHVSGILIGTRFVNRRDLQQSGVHRPPMGGISGNPSEGADSIVVSGGYEDDEDYEDVIVYTGHGGNEGGVQVRDQVFKSGNKGLAVSCDRGLPVRVIRGRGGHPGYSPAAGFRYDGLFFVADYWSELGRSGFRVYRYRLEQLADTESHRSSDSPEGTVVPERTALTVQRLVRDTRVTRWAKRLHDYRCQICDTQLRTPSGLYAECAHIRPLGRPHNGPDVPENVLVLCPNHHVMFDRGALMIDDDMAVIDGLTGDAFGQLHMLEDHAPDPEHVAYHRDHRRLGR